ncbi:hypothetical protein Q0812_10380 [Brevundimonas sp. 2R-24]|uniref:Fibronectin type-III domain-containing protein n=1 Tax=Peiella sedimenti TaxID=3061083 RepID=A0ABT8SMN7_9CAUL|nr:hypothetical protein [Caulobacteraceae bacterium XZ-24]
MPPVAAFAAAAFTAVKVAAVVAIKTLAAMSIATVAKIGLAVLSVAGLFLLRKLPLPESTGQQLDTKLDPGAGVPVAFGRTATGGTMVYQDSWGSKNKYLGQVMVLSAGGPIEGIETYRASDYTVNFSGNPATGVGTAASITPSTAGSKLYRNKLKTVWRRGDTPEATSLATYASQLGGYLPGIDGSFKLSGLAHALVVCEHDQDAFPQGVPKHLWVLKGVKCYDPRLDDTYPGGEGPHRLDDPTTWAFTENPYIAALAWILGRFENGKKVWGIGAQAAEIDWDAYVAAANIADANEWKVGGVVTTTDDKFAVLNTILQAGGGAAIARGAQLSCRINAPKTSVFTLRPDDIVGDVEVANSPQWRDRKNRIVPQYREPNAAWEIIAGNAVTEADYVAEDGGEERTAEIHLPFVQSATQAAQLAAYELVNGREFLSFSLTAKPKLLTVRAGDCITVNLPELGATDLKCVVESRDFDPASMTVKLALRSETDGKHDFALGRTQDAPSSPTLNRYDPTALEAPNAAVWSITATDLSTLDGQSQPALIVEASANAVSDNPFATSVICEFRENSASVWSAFSEGPPTTTRFEVTGLNPQTAYDLGIRYRTREGLVTPRLVVGSATTGASISGGVMPGGIDWTGNTIVNVPVGLTTTANGLLTANHILHGAEIVSNLLDAANDDIAAIQGEITDIESGLNVAANQALSAANAALLAAGWSSANATSAYGFANAASASAVHSNANAALAANAALLSATYRDQAQSNAVTAANQAGIATTQAAYAAANSATAVSNANLSATYRNQAQSNAVIAANQAGYAAANAAGALNSSNLSATYRDQSSANAMIAANQAGFASSNAAAASASANLSASHSGWAAANAAIATTQAGYASANSAAASTSATVAASVGAASINKNPVFADYPASGYPAKWGAWSMPATYHSRVAGQISPYAIRLIGAAGFDVGIQQSSTDAGSSLAIQPGWYIAEADVTLVSGALTGAGVYVEAWNAAGSAVAQSFSFPFSTTPDISDAAPGAGTTGRTYRFRRLFQVTASSAFQLVIYAMSHWSALGSTTAANSIDWHRCAVRAATSAEIAAQRADTNSTNALSYIASNATAWASNVVALANRTTTLEASLQAQGNLIANPSGQNGLHLWTYKPGYYWGTSTYSSVAPLWFFTTLTGVTGDGYFYYDVPAVAYTPYALSWNAEIFGGFTGYFNVSLQPIPADKSAVLSRFKNAAGETYSDAVAGVQAGQPEDHGRSGRRGSLTVYPTDPATAYVRVIFYYAGTGNPTYCQFGLWNVKLEVGSQPTTYNEASTLTTTVARVSTSETAISDLTGRTMARWSIGTSVPGSAAFITAQAETTPGAAPTSNVAIGARAIQLYNQVGDEWLPALTVSGGNATFAGRLNAGTSISVGSGSWPVALASKDFVVTDGTVVSFGTDLGQIPALSFSTLGLAALSSGETYNLYADSLTSTGFTARLKINTPGSPSSYNLTTDTTPGSGPTRQIDKGANPDATGGIYTLTVSGQQSWNLPDQGMGQTIEYSGSVTFSVWVKVGGVWSQVGTITAQIDGLTFGTGNMGSTVSATENFTVSETMTLPSNIQAFGVSYASRSGGSSASLTDFNSVAWTSPGSGSGTRTATPSGQTTTVTVRPRT